MAKEKMTKKLEKIYKALKGENPNIEEAKKDTREVASDIDVIMATMSGRDPDCDPGETIPE